MTLLRIGGVLRIPQVGRTCCRFFIVMLFRNRLTDRDHHGGLDSTVPRSFVLFVFLFRNCSSSVKHCTCSHSSVRHLLPCAVRRPKPSELSDDHHLTRRSSLRIRNCCLLDWEPRLSTSLRRRDHEQPHKKVINPCPSVLK